MDEFNMDVEYSEPGPSNTTYLDLRPLAVHPADSEDEEFDSDEHDEHVFDGYSEHVDGGTPFVPEDDDGGVEGAEDESFCSSNTEAPSELQQVLGINLAYQQFLDIAIAKLTEALEKNRQLQKELPALLTKRVQRHRKPKVRRNWYQSLIFHHPYFRDIDGMPAPPNEDELAKRANKELDPYISKAVPWSAKECCSLVTAVQSNLLQQNLEAPMDRKEALSERLLATDDPSQNAEIKEHICQLEEQMTKVRGMSLVELLENSTRPIDWLRIAAMDMRSNRTAFVCEMQWRHVLDVRLNQDPWTPAEEKRLCTLVTKWNERCWDQVAEELKTGRSAFQCALHYCRHYATRLNVGPFTPEEDERLKMLIMYCTDGDVIPWSQVAHYMGTRSKKQVKNRYERSMDPHIQHGRWTAVEDMILLIAIRLYESEGWSKVASLLPSRTSNQCREHYMAHLAYNITTGPYTPLEDKRLVELVEEHGVGCWAKVAKEMPWRTGNSVLTRYKRLSQLVGKDKLTVADLEKCIAAPVAAVGSSRRPQISAMNRRMDIYRSVLRMINTSTQREAALKLVKGDDKTVDRLACLRLYQRMLHQLKNGRATSYLPVQAKTLNKAIAQYAQVLHRPVWSNMAAYEHQEMQAVINVLHDQYGLERPPGRPELEQVATVPILEEFFRTGLQGAPEESKQGSNRSPPLLPPNETTVATFGRLVDRFADGDPGKCCSFLLDCTSFPELSAALDAVNVESIRCTQCTSRDLLEDELSSLANRELAQDFVQHACLRCDQLQETRRNYDVLCGYFISYFFWALLVVDQNVIDTVDLPPATRSGRKIRYVRKKMKRPWVKAAWAERKRLAAEAALGEESQGGQEEDDGGEAVVEGNADGAVPSTSRG